MSSLTLQRGPQRRPLQLLLSLAVLLCALLPSLVSSQSVYTAPLYTLYATPQPARLTLNAAATTLYFIETDGSRGGSLPLPSATPITFFVASPPQTLLRAITPDSSSNVWISDSGTFRLCKFDGRTGAQLLCIPVNLFENPCLSLAADSQGYIYCLTNMPYGIVQRLASTGEQTSFISSTLISIAGNGPSTSSIFAIDAYDTLWVSTTPLTYAVQLSTANNGSVLQTIRLPLDYPPQACIDPSGSFTWELQSTVTRPAPGLIAYRTNASSAYSTTTFINSTLYNLAPQSSCAVDSAGNFYFAGNDPLTATIFRLRLNTSDTSAMQVTPPGNSSGPFIEPQSMAMDASGVVYISYKPTSAQGQVVAMTVGGQRVRAAWSTQSGYPDDDMRVDSQGRLYILVATSTNNTVKQFSGTGALLYSLNLTVISNETVLGINVDALDRLWLGTRSTLFALDTSSPSFPVVATLRPAFPGAGTNAGRFHVDLAHNRLFTTYSNYGYVGLASFTLSPDLSSTSLLTSISEDPTGQPLSIGSVALHPRTNLLYVRHKPLQALPVLLVLETAGLTVVGNYSGGIASNWRGLAFDVVTGADTVWVVDAGGLLVFPAMPALQTASSSSAGGGGGGGGGGRSSSSTAAGAVTVQPASSSPAAARTSTPATTSTPSPVTSTSFNPTSAAVTSTAASPTPSPSTASPASSTAPAHVPTSEPIHTPSSTAASSSSAPIPPPDTIPATSTPSPPSPSSSAADLPPTSAPASSSTGGPVPVPEYGGDGDSSVSTTAVAGAVIAVLVVVAVAVVVCVVWRRRKGRMGVGEGGGVGVG